MNEWPEYKHVFSKQEVLFKREARIREKTDTVSGAVFTQQQVEVWKKP